jgi:hypothetical protein
MRPSHLLAAAALALPAAMREQPPQPPQIPRYDGPKLETTRIADGVYAFVFDNPHGPAVDGTRSRS